MPTATAERRLAADDRRFFSVMAFAALAIVFAGFGTSYYLWPLTRATHFPAGQPISPSLPLIVHVHALAFTAWIVLFVVQVRLVATGRTALHRRLGVAAACFIPFMVGTGWLTALQGARDGWNPGGPFPDALGFMIAGVRDLAVFTTLAVAGLAWRRRPDVHKRLMLLATLGGMLWPAITRMPVIAGRIPLMFALLIALVLAPAVRDLWLGVRARWVSLYAGLGALAAFPVAVVVGNSAWWRALAAWLIE